MMNALVIYDSVYGNTKKIAEAVGMAIPGSAIRHVGKASPSDLGGVGLLIVGSPTHGGRPTPAIHKFLEGIPKDSLRGARVAAFDTWIAKQGQGFFMRAIIGFFGHASQHIAAKLQKAGGKTRAPPEGFLVKGKEGPLAEGELERAAAWAKGLAENSA